MTKRQGCIRTGPLASVLTGICIGIPTTFLTHSRAGIFALTFKLAGVGSSKRRRFPPCGAGEVLEGSESAGDVGFGLKKWRRFPPRGGGMLGEGSKNTGFEIPNPRRFPPCGTEGMLAEDGGFGFKK